MTGATPTLVQVVDSVEVSEILDVLRKGGILDRITYLEWGDFKVNMMPASAQSIAESKLDAAAAAKELEERILYGSNGG